MLIHVLKICNMIKIKKKKNTSEKRSLNIHIVFKTFKELKIIIFVVDCIITYKNKILYKIIESSKVIKRKRQENEMKTRPTATSN